MISIIGGSGFVGSFLIKELIPKYSVTNLDKNNSPFFQNISTKCDVRDINTIDFKKGTSTVVLLAAEHRDDVKPSSLYYDVNVKGTKNVLKKMDKIGIKNLVFTSSVAIYGLNKANPNENHQKDPFNHYGKSKWQAELIIRSWFDSDPINKSVTIIRPTVIFGERNRGNVHNLFKQIVSENFIMIGDGKNKKSMTYVGNVVGFIKDRIVNVKTGYNIFNYADKPDFSMQELVNLIENKLNLNLIQKKIPYWIGMLGGYGFDLLAYLLKRKLAISSVRVKKFCATTQFCSEKVHNIYDPPYTLEEGISKTLDHEFINPKKDDVLFYSE